MCVDENNEDQNPKVPGQITLILTSFESVTLSHLNILINLKIHVMYMHVLFYQVQFYMI